MDQPGSFANNMGGNNPFNLDCPCCYRPGEPFDAEAPGMARISAPHKLGALRVLMAENDVDAYLVFGEDAHNSEYVSRCDERRSFLTGFTGSAGVALVTKDRALCWTDSRYFIQATEQLPVEWTLMKMFEPNVPLVEDELYDSLRGKRIGLDPSTFPKSRAAHWKEGWAKRAKSETDGGDDDESSLSLPELVPINTNLVDEIWPKSIRPPIPQNTISVHDIRYAGESVPSKLERVRKAAKEEHRCDGLVVVALDQNAWLYNLRGTDIDCNPVFFSYSVVSPTEAHIFLGRMSGVGVGDGGGEREDWLGGDVRSHLEANGVTVRSYDEFGPAALDGIFPDGLARVLVDRGSCSMAVAEAVSATERCTLVTSEGVGPVEQFKSQKSKAEIKGIEESSVRDSVALVQFSAWLTEQMKMEEAKRDDMSETALDKILLQFREKQSGFVQPSFDTISSVGPNAAVVHYKPSAGSDNERTLTPSDIYLLDSGGQYLDGTTDVTRTYHFGDPTDEQRRLYTRVLQGHIDLAMAVFPSGTPGLVLDAFARAPLWRDGLTYGHGTGHGIGAYLNVHEGPMGIGGGNQPGNVIRKNPRMQAFYLEPIVSGMYLSNEPGYYLEGKFGFRIESDMIAVPREEVEAEGSIQFLKFDTVTKVPMCRALIDPSILSAEERQWLNDYHSDCLSTLTPLLSEDARALSWLQAETLPFRA